MIVAFDNDAKTITVQSETDDEKQQFSDFLDAGPTQPGSVFVALVAPGGMPWHPGCGKLTADFSGS